MAIRSSEAIWEGSLREGKGVMKLGSGAFEGVFSYATRFEEQSGTNPEELLGAAHAGCYSMSLSSRLTTAGFPPEHIHTTARVHLGRVDGKSRILKIELENETRVKGLSFEKFMELAQDAKVNCPVSFALAGVEISLDARLV
jgi:lipoyl-dependent peroxiredoxin